MGNPVKTREPKCYAVIGWTAKDVQGVAEGRGEKMTRAQAQDFIERYESRIVDRLIDFGHEVIDTLLGMDGR